MRKEIFEWKEKETKIIKLTVSGDIVMGDGVGLSNAPSINKSIVYAGTVIENFELVKE